MAGRRQEAAAAAAVEREGACKTWEAGAHGGTHGVEWVTHGVGHGRPMRRGCMQGMVGRGVPLRCAWVMDEAGAALSLSKPQPLELT